MLNNIFAVFALQDAKRYQAMKNRLFLLSVLLNFLFLSVLVLSGFSRQIKTWLLFVFDGFFYINALYFSVFSISAFLLSLPLDYYGGFVLEHRFGLSRQALGAWFKDVLKKSLIVFVVSIVTVQAVYFLIDNFQHTWWLWATLFWFAVSVLFTRIFPKMILPLFFKSRPLPPGVLRDRIFSLLDKAKIAVKDVYVLDFSKKTVKANAMVAGLGAGRQIFLSDTLVQGFSVQEVEAVLAHELGHYVRHDVFKLVASNLVGTFFSFYLVAAVAGRMMPFFGFSSVGDIAGFPLLLAIFLFAGLALLPFQNGFSRFLEKQADIFALKKTGDKKAFISMMQRLGELNFADFSPSKTVEYFLYDHPPIGKRIKLAEDMRI